MNNSIGFDVQRIGVAPFRFDKKALVRCIPYRVFILSTQSEGQKNNKEKEYPSMAPFKHGNTFCIGFLNCMEA